jgi:hypothetical protein
MAPIRQVTLTKSKNHEPAFDQTFHELIVGSYQRFVGQCLLPRRLNAEESA